MDFNQKEKIKDIFSDVDFVIDEYDCLFGYNIHNNYLKAFFYYQGKEPVFLNLNIDQIEKVYISASHSRTIIFQKTNSENVKIEFSGSEINKILYHISAALMKNKSERSNSNIQSL